MGISCTCYEQVGITSVGEPREVTCRHQRKCYCCARVILPGSPMYQWSMFDWDCKMAESPIMICEECGDMALNLMELGFCFDFGSGIRRQWLEYLHDVKPEHPAVKKEYGK